MDKQKQCSDCSKYFTSNSNLFRHERKVHGKHINRFVNKSRVHSTTQDSQILNKSQSPISCSQTFELIDSRINPHTSVALHSYASTNSPTQSTITESTTDNITSILSTSFHPSNDTVTSEQPTFTSPTLPVLPKSSTSLKQASPKTPVTGKNGFAGAPPRSQRIACPVESCKKTFPRYYVFRNHIEVDHKIPIEHEKLYFSSVKDFLVWKKELEQNTLSYYVKNSAGHRTRNGGTILYYNCDRSYTSREPTDKLSKILNSRKIGNACPSRIITKVNNDGDVVADYWKTHLGHDKLAKYVRIDKKLRRRLNKKKRRVMKRKRMDKAINKKRTEVEVSCDRNETCSENSNTSSTEDVEKAKARVENLLLKINHVIFNTGYDDSLAETLEKTFEHILQLIAPKENNTEYASSAEDEIEAKAEVENLLPEIKNVIFNTGYDKSLIGTFKKLLSIFFS
ncbi:uncharacterized protein LOC113391191 [Ctenocephalides felis]|uniref:uncharacterized protein LOC113391191 n=1 Tax=Ctenocephalides felis TaxID=7515 RepID=UPI000E6E1BE1|nr:uncharacterized protein LOC113391191 [Ctenocephalides felis]